MKDYNLNIIKTLFNNLHTQNNYTEENLINDIKSVNFDRLVALKIENDSLENNLVDPFLMQFTRNQTIFNQFLLPNIKISMSTWIEKLEEMDFDFDEFVENNIDSLYAESKIHKYLLEEYSDNVRTEDELMYIVKSVKMSTNDLIRYKKSKQQNQLETYIKAIIKLKSEELKIHVTPKTYKVEEYVKYLKNNDKYSLQKENSFKNAKGITTQSNSIYMNMDSFFDIYFKLIDPRDFYIELEKVINHELFHTVQNERMIHANKFVSEDMYSYLKNQSIASLDHEFYLKYHNYFELEIEANIYAYSQIIKNAKNKDQEERIEELIKIEKQRRCTRTYDSINDRFDLLLLAFPNIINEEFYKFEYDENGVKDIKSLINTKKNFHQELDFELANHPQDEIVTYKREKLDNDFINSIIFNAIFKMTQENIDINLKLLEEFELLILKESLIFGKLKYMNQLNTLLENRSNYPFIDHFTKENPRVYIKESLSKIDIINQKVDKKINEFKSKLRR